MPSTEHRLLQEYVAGRPEAFDELYVRLWPLVVDVALRELRDLDRAEDVAQTVLTALAAEPAVVPAHVDPAAWMVVCARNRARNRIRGDSRRTTHEQVARDGVRPPQPAPDDRMIDRETVQHVRQAIGDLPDRYRLPVLLHYVQGLTKPEIATRLGLKEGTVSMQLDRARGLLRHLLSRRGVSATALLAAMPVLCAGQGTMADAQQLRALAGSADHAAAREVLAAGQAPLAASAWLAGALAAVAVAATLTGWWIATPRLAASDAGAAAGASSAAVGATDPATDATAVSRRPTEVARSGAPGIPPAAATAAQADQAAGDADRAAPTAPGEHVFWPRFERRYQTRSYVLSDPAAWQTRGLPEASSAGEIARQLGVVTSLPADVHAPVPITASPATELRLPIPETLLADGGGAIFTLRLRLVRIGAMDFGFGFAHPAFRSDERFPGVPSIRRQRTDFSWTAGEICTLRWRLLPVGFYQGHRVAEGFIESSSVPGDGIVGRDWLLGPPAHEPWLIRLRLSHHWQILGGLWQELAETEVDGPIPGGAPR